MANIVPIERCVAKGGPETCRYHKKVIQLNSLAIQMEAGKTTKEQLDAYFQLRSFVEDINKVKEEEGRIQAVAREIKANAEASKINEIIDDINSWAYQDLSHQTIGDAVIHSYYYNNNDLAARVFNTPDIQKLVEIIAISFTDGDKSKISMNLDEQGDAYISLDKDDVDILTQSAIAERNNDFQALPYLEFWNKKNGKDRWGKHGNYFYFTPDDFTTEEWDSFETPR